MIISDDEMKKITLNLKAEEDNERGTTTRVLRFRVADETSIATPEHVGGPAKSTDAAQPRAPLPIVIEEQAMGFELKVAAEQQPAEASDDVLLAADVGDGVGLLIAANDPRKQRAGVHQHEGKPAAQAAQAAGAWAELVFLH